MLRTTCSMRKETNALKDANVSFGDLYVFEKHLCFDWKVFGFHKQQVVPLTDVIALLKSTEARQQRSNPRWTGAQAAAAPPVRPALLLLGASREPAALTSLVGWPPLRRFHALACSQLRMRVGALQQTTTCNRK